MSEERTVHIVEVCNPTWKQFAITYDKREVESLEQKAVRATGVGSGSIRTRSERRDW